MPDIFVEKQSEGRWHAIRNGTTIATGTTQNECGSNAKKKYPDDPLLTGRVEHTDRGNPDHWRRFEDTTAEMLRAQYGPGKTSESGNPDTVNRPPPTLTVFVSHSSKDALIAKKLVELLRAALNLHADAIRCTSVDGYRLPAGVLSETQLRSEVVSAKIFIGLITPSSLASTYVVFELGARWGAKLHMLPLLAGIERGALRGP